MAKAIEEKKIAYLNSSNFLRLWSERECEICKLEGVGLSMTRAALPLLYARPVEAVAEQAEGATSLRGDSKSMFLLHDPMTNSHCRKWRQKYGRGWCRS